MRYSYMKNTLAVKYLSTFLLMLLASLLLKPLNAQDSLRIGDEFDYLAYQIFSHHVETPRYYYSTADVGLVKWDKNDYSYELLSKVDGLSDVEPSQIAYDKTTDAVIVAYANSNIDILYPDHTLNVRDILVNRKITGRRNIHKLLTEDGKLYIVADYGLSIYDLQNEEFILSLFTDARTRDFNYSQDRFFISTDKAYYTYDRTRGEGFIVSLVNWDTLGIKNKLPADITPGLIGVNEHCVVLMDKNRLFIAGQNELEFRQLMTLEKNAVIPFMKTDNGEIQIGVNLKSGKDHVLKIDRTCAIVDSVYSPCMHDISDYLETSTGDILIGDGWLGFHYINNMGMCNVIDLPGPQGVQAYGLTFRNDTLYVAAGGVNKMSYNAQRNNGGFSYFDGKEWHSYSLLSDPQLRRRDFGDIMQALPSPDGSKVYLNSAWNGLAVFDFEKFTFYDSYNSCLEVVGNGDSTIRIPAMVMDDEGNLWLSNFFARHGLQYIGAEGTCKSYNIPVSAQLGEMILDEEGILWASITGNDGGILIYDPHKDKFRIISSSNSVLSGDVRSLALDRNGAVWVGASNGAYVFYSAYNDRGERPAIDIDQDGIGDYLLMDQFVTTIAVDAANRKWFGTNNGVIVQSPNGLFNELRLTTENSALPSDVILDIAFDNERGIAYIGTEKGILGIKIKAVEGGPMHKKNIYAYPNPVRPGYDGPIAIKGLAENANVKIVDQEGFLVKKLQAYGGQAIWDGTNLKNEKVASGVYVIYSAAYGTMRKPDAATTKVLIIR